MSEQFVTTFRVNKELGKLKQARGMAPKVFRAAFTHLQELDDREIARLMLSMQGPFDHKIPVKVDPNYYNQFSTKAQEVGFASVSDLVRVGMTLAMQEMGLTDE